MVPRVLGFGPMGLMPLVDGLVLPHHPFDTVAAPESIRACPFLVGSTKDEATLFAGPLPRWGQFTDDEIVELHQAPCRRARPASRRSLQETPSRDSPSYLLADIVTDFWMRQARQPGCGTEGPHKRPRRYSSMCSSGK